MARKPIARILGPSGGDLVGRLGKRLLSATMIDQAGQESDSLAFVVSVKPPFPAGPPKGTRYLAELGWAANATRLVGIYTSQSNTLGGDPESGYTMTVNCRASDFIDAMKKVDSEHFDEETAGGIFRKIASGGGMSAVVDGDIDGVEIPYRLRWNQSPVDFASELAEELGATLKLAGGKLVVQKRGGGKSGGGTGLPPIVVPFSRDYGFEIDMETRGEFAETAGEWFDPIKGLLSAEKGKGVGAASRFSRVHPFANQDLAKRGGEAAVREEARQSVSGSFDMAGNPAATAEAPVKPAGYGTAIDGLDIVAACVTHEVTFDDGGGWITTVEVESSGEKAAG